METSSEPGGDTGGTPAPSGTPAASPAAPSPSSSTSKSGPITGSDFTRAASAARTPSQPGATGTHAASDALASDAAPDSLTPPAPAKAPVPYDRFEEVNGKYDKLKWAETYQAEEVTQATQLVRWLDRDPKGAYAYLTQQLQQHGLIDAPAPPQAPAQQPAAHVDQRGRPLPDVPVEGTDIKLYSAEQAQSLVDWALQQVDERLKPFQEDRERAQQEAHRAQVWNQASTQAQSMVAEAESWPGFKENMGEIQQAMEADRRISLHTAYQRVVSPKLEQHHRDKFVQEQRTRSNGTTHNPGSPAPPSSKDLRSLSISQLFSREMSRRGLGK